jgi:DNA-binding beta-propeller fold protein YncE
VKKKRFLRSCAAATLFVAAASSFGHGTSGIIEIEAIDSRIDAQLEVTAGKARKAYAALAKVIRRRSRPSRGLADDMTKLIAVAKACGKAPLAEDHALRDGLASPEAQADAYLADAPDDVIVASLRLERIEDRDRVRGVVDRVRLEHAAAAAKGQAGDEIGMLAGFRTAGKRLADAGKLVQTLIARQRRRGSPGQTLKKGPAGTIDTYAGIGVSGFSGDGGPALDASFYFPTDVALDGDGLLNICDFNNHRIRRIDKDGKVRTVAGQGELGDTEGPALQAKLHHPSSIALRADGSLMISGWHVHRLIVLADGTITHFAGSGSPGNTGDEGPVGDATFDYPSFTAFGGSGNWYVSDQNNARIRRVDAAGAIHAFAGTGVAGFGGDDGPALDAQFDNPDGEIDAPAGRCCLDPLERFLYVADTSNHRVRKVDLTTNVATTLAGNGEVGAAGDGGPATAASLDTPVDVDCDADGNVFVCDRGRHVVRKIDVSTGVITTVAGIAGLDGYGGDGNPGNNARLDRPQGIFVDRARGRLYVADTLNSVIRVVWE